MKVLFIVLLISSYNYLWAQNKVFKSLNEVELHAPITAYQQELEFYTGEESFFEGNESIAATVKANWEKGIKEGVYYEGEYSEISGYNAQRTSFFFYQDELFKLRWAFEYSAETKISVLAPVIEDFLKEQLGEPHVDDFGFVKNTVWESGEYKVMLFQEGRAHLTVELRHEPTHLHVESIK